MEKKRLSVGVTEESLLIYGAYTQIVESLQHYNRVQTIYRTYVSTWLMATFVGIGYVLTSMEVGLPFHPLVTTAFMCVASSMGVLLIWYMDLIVCEQQIAASVYEGIVLEQQHEWLPRFYHNIKNMSGLINYVSLKCILYIGCISILIIVGGSSLTFWVINTNHYLSFVIPIFVFVLIFLTSMLLISSTKKSDPYYRLQKIKGTKFG